MAYSVKNSDGTISFHPSPNVKIHMKLEDPKETLELFLNPVSSTVSVENVESKAQEKNKM